MSDLNFLLIRDLEFQWAHWKSSSDGKEYGLVGLRDVLNHVRMSACYPEMSRNQVSTGD